MNVWYIEHMSLWLDIKILFMTVGSVLRKDDNVSVQGSDSDAGKGQV